jgi:hypothetical protein
MDQLDTLRVVDPEFGNGATETLGLHFNLEDESVSRAINYVDRYLRL